MVASDRNYMYGSARICNPWTAQPPSQVTVLLGEAQSWSTMLLNIFPPPSLYSSGIMPLNCVCEICGFRHNAAHRCPIFRLNAAIWIDAADESARPPVPAHKLSDFDVICPHCRARTWRGERINCCGAGWLQLPLEDDIPSELRDIILSSHVRMYIRRYNMAFSMASVGHDNRSLPDSTFILGGRTFHRIGSLRPNAAADAVFAQIYTLDDQESAIRRIEVVRDHDGVLRRPVLELLHRLMLEHNPWVRQLRKAAEQNTPEIEWRSDVDVSNMTIGSVVTAPGSRSIIVRQKSSDLPQFISDGHSLYHTLTYPLLFPTGASGWHDDMKCWDARRNCQQRVTLLEWARHLLMHRDTPTFVQRCERLSLEFYCDLYAQYEARMAAFHSLPRQQVLYRCASYRAIHDQLQRDASLSDVGRPIILPSSFVGSPRYYHQLYLDAMALPLRFHKPDLFITITCNPCWSEIAQAVPSGSHWRFHPDIVGRVFMLKFQAILQEITVSQIFGPVLAFVWRVEWQARGLPHVHMLLILADRVLSAHSIDRIVSAEFPNPELQPALHAAVQQFMVHGPCDVRNHLSCRSKSSDGMCIRRYPKAMCTTTRVLHDGFPEYRRRNRFVGRDGDRTITDEWVVPHNPYLIERYQCHINVEVAGHVRSCKYIYKYCFKPPDQVNLELNEINAYLSGRLLSCAEATFRILGLRLHQEWPSVERLDMHLPLQNNVVFNPMADTSEIEEQLPESTSKLLQWFVLNQNDDAARQWRYIDIPEHYVWDAKGRRWQRRVQNRMKVARLPSVSNYNLELQALRLILHVARGAQSFVDLMSYNGHTYPTFRDTAKAAGLLEDDGEAISIFYEMTRVGVSVHTLREQFCAVLVHCSPANPVELFNMFASDLMYEEVAENSCRVAIQDIDRIMRTTFGRSLRDPEFNFTVDVEDDESDILIPRMADVDPNLPLLETLRPLLSAEQQNAADMVLDSVIHHCGFNVFAVVCSAGTGKTLFANYIACTLRSQGRMVACVAASALAASLLEGGHTAHHALHIPIPANDGTYCSLSLAERHIIKSTDLLIWDEASMIHKDVADTVSRTLQDIKRDSRPFGGITVVFTGDFKQLLPVVRGGRGDNYTLQRCDWWPLVRFVEFRNNWRAQHDLEFANLLESVGRGILAEVPIPKESLANSVEELTTRVFGNNLLNADASSMVLTLTLDDAEAINDHCLQKTGGCIRESYSADTLLHCQNPDAYPLDIIAGIRMHGAPPSCLKLKLGARYMIIKNMMKSVFNGVRCQLVAYAGSRCVFVKLISGPGSGTTILLPTCVFIISPEQSGLPFSVRRRQFPLICAYAVTVHKAQGQTLSTVGLYITTEIFTHGQLYTALSRTRGWKNIIVHSTLPNPSTLTNCVYKHVLHF